MHLKPDKLYCFSPLAMLATFIIEITLVVYVIFRYKLTPIARLVVIMLFLLALFQLAEYRECGSASATILSWSRIGYIAITLLPALALHLVFLIAKRKERLMLWLAYGSSFAFAVIFGFSSSAFITHACTGNYAIFQLAQNLGGLYFVYYYFWLLAGIGLALYFSINTGKSSRRALVWQVFGYLSFLLPTAIVNTVKPETISGLPSIMCGFAVIYAIVLALAILPSIQNRKS